MKQVPKLNDYGKQLAKRFETLFGDMECCCQPCDYCSHPGHPDQLAETPEAWEDTATVTILELKDICSHSYGDTTAKYRFCPHCGKELS